MIDNSTHLLANSLSAIFGHLAELQIQDYLAASAVCRQTTCSVFIQIILGSGHLHGTATESSIIAIKSTVHTHID